MTMFLGGGPPGPVPPDPLVARTFGASAPQKAGGFCALLQKGGFTIPKILSGQTHSQGVRFYLEMDLTPM